VKDGKGGMRGRGDFMVRVFQYNSSGNKMRSGRCTSTAPPPPPLWGESVHGLKQGVSSVNQRGSPSLPLTRTHQAQDSSSLLIPNTTLSQGRHKVRVSIKDIFIAYHTFSKVSALVNSHSNFHSKLNFREFRMALHIPFI
jgi:hypothetical protein